MNTSTAEPRATELTISDDQLHVVLADGRKLSVPITWFPRLAGATDAQRNDWEWIGNGEGIHWPQIDEDLSISGFLRGIHAAR